MSADRLDGLRSDVTGAIAELSRMSDHEPATAQARRAMRLTIHTLECFWLPALASSKGVDAQPFDR